MGLARIRRAALSLVLLSSAALGQNADIHPIIKLEKAKYVLGESILFWVGLEAATPNSTLPAEIVQARQPCVLNIAKPDGTHESQTISWPMDWLSPTNGWRGGHTLQPGSLGNYSLVLECSGVSTAPVTLSVIKNQIARQVKVTLQFQKSGNLHRSASVPLVFDVRNESPFYIQFPERGAEASGMIVDNISVHVVRRDPPATKDLFYPPEKLARRERNATANSKFPTITLVPGGHFEQQLYLEDAYKLDEPGEYEITVSTVVTVFIRDPDGKLKDYSPVRLAAKQTATLKISNSVY